MGQVGFQDYWVTGSRMYFQRDAIAGVEQPWLDLGTIQVANPEITPEKVQLNDPDGGIRSVIDQAVTGIDENYSIVCSNLNTENLALMFLADPPTASVQAAAEITPFINYCYPERLLKIHDGATPRIFQYAFDTIFGIVIAGDRITTTANDITAISATAKTLTTTTDLSTAILAGDDVIVHQDGLANKANARTYQVVTSAANLITVLEEPSAAEAAVTVDITYMDNTSGTTGEVLAQKVASSELLKDWEILSVDRGVVRFDAAGTVFTAALFPSGSNLSVYGNLAAVASAKRTFNPQSSQGTIQGAAVLVYSREGNAQQTVREFQCAVTPAGSALNDEDFSNITLMFTVISALTAETPAGRMIQFKGPVPQQA